nr:hypothetical protein [Microbispora catharanthi]
MLGLRLGVHSGSLGSGLAAAGEVAGLVDHEYRLVVVQVLGT